MTPRSLRIAPAAQHPFEYRGDALILPLTEEGRQLRGFTKKVDAALQGAISHALRRKAFSGKLSERCLLHPVRQLRYQRTNLGHYIR